MVMTRNKPHTAPSMVEKEDPKSYIQPVANATVPYWRSELHPLDEYRSTESLPAQCDIAIIGAGMAGVSLAYYLIQAFKDADTSLPSIVLLEARQTCSGATGRNGGHVKAKTAGLLGMKKSSGVEAAEKLGAFVNDVIYSIKRVVEKEKLDCEFELRRSFDVFLDTDEAEEVIEGFEASVANMEKWTFDRVVVPQQHVEQVTSIKGAKAAISVPCCSFWPYKFVTQLLERIIDNINLQTTTLVSRVFQDAGDQILHTPRGDLRAKKVIFATNGYTGGISPTYQSKIIPVCITASHLTPFRPVVPHLTHTYNIAYGPNFVDYLNPRPDGGIVVGGGKNHYSKDRKLWYNVWNDSVLLPNVKEHFGGLMQRNFGGWEKSGSKLEGLWVGIIGYTSDGLPHIGEIPEMEGRQYVIAGFNGGGMAMIFEAAKGLASMVKDDVSFEETGLPRMFKSTKERLKADPAEGQPD